MLNRPTHLIRLVGTVTAVAGATSLALVPAAGATGGTTPSPAPCPVWTNVIAGTDGDDYLVGTSGNDVILGRGGDDVIEGGAGHDSIGGGTGNDTIAGGEGDDCIVGGPGDDTTWQWSWIVNGSDSEASVEARYEY